MDRGILRHAILFSGLVVLFAAQCTVQTSIQLLRFCRRSNALLQYKVRPGYPSVGCMFCPADLSVLRRDGRERERATDGAAAVHVAS